MPHPVSVGHIAGSQHACLWGFITLLQGASLHETAKTAAQASDACCRQLDKFKPSEMCNLVWGVGQLGPQCDPSLLRDILQASDAWSEVCLTAIFCWPCMTTKTCWLFAHGPRCHRRQNECVVWLISLSCCGALPYWVVHRPMH